MYESHEGARACDRDSKEFKSSLRPTIFLEVNPDFVGLCTGGFGPCLTRLLFGPCRDVTPVITFVGQLDAREAEPKLNRTGLGQYEVVSEGKTEGFKTTGRCGLGKRALTYTCK